MIFNAVRPLSFRKRGFRFECKPPGAIGLWLRTAYGETMVATLDPFEAKRLRDWLDLALPNK